MPLRCASPPVKNKYYQIKIDQTKQMADLS